MVTRAIARYIRISPRKTKKVLDLIRGMNVVKAEALLDTLSKRPTSYIKRLLVSAVDSANKKTGLSASELYISKVKADGGPTLKRYRAATMGRATMVRHRTSHITLELDQVVKRQATRDKGQEKKVSGKGQKISDEAVKAKTKKTVTKKTTKKKK